MTVPRGPAHIIAWTSAIAALMTVSSLLGLVDPDVYAAETDNWTLQARGQDLGNLLAALTLVAACWAHRRGAPAAGAVWLGTLFYVIYAFSVYALAVHFNRLFPVYVAVLGLSIYAVLRNTEELWASTPARAGTRLAGYTLIGTGTVFALLWLSEIMPAVVTGDPPSSLADTGLPVNPIHVIDLSVVLPGFVLTGLSLLHGRPAGRFLAGPWLVFSVLMGTSIVAAVLLMAADGESGTVPPLVGVSVVVLLSLVAAWRHLRSTTRAEQHRAPVSGRAAGLDTLTR
jgi:hypothetical protein